MMLAWRAGVGNQELYGMKNLSTAIAQSTEIGTMVLMMENAMPWRVLTVSNHPKRRLPVPQIATVRILHQLTSRRPCLQVIAGTMEYPAFLVLHLATLGSPLDHSVWIGVTGLAR